MKDDKTLVLYFKNGTKIDSTDLAAKLSKRFEGLKDPLVIPYNEDNPNQPLIVFNRGAIYLTVGPSNITIVYNKEIHVIIYDTIMEIIEYFENLDYSFERMGYVSSFIHNKKTKEVFKKKIFKEDFNIGEEFQLHWYNKELIDSVSVNVWRKYFSNLEKNLEFISLYDINTPIDEEYNITSEFLSSFIKQCDKYIEEKEKEFK